MRIGRHGGPVAPYDPRLRAESLLLMRGEAGQVVVGRNVPRSGNYVRQPMSPAIIFRQWVRRSTPATQRVLGFDLTEAGGSHAWS